MLFFRWTAQERSSSKSVKLRVVFDSSAKYKEVSLNSRLLQGPDQLNNLFGVLLRWRRGRVAVNCDIQKMFHSFFVTKEDREYLRFFWVKGDDPNGEPVECVANVHIFGARSSPAVANFALRKAALLSGDQYCDEVKDFVFNNFYVDDGLLSTDSSMASEGIVRGTQGMLKEHGIVLHKIVSNSEDLLQKFPREALAPDLQTLGEGPAPLQKSLGVKWDVRQDVFRFEVSNVKKPFTRRGALAVLNAIWDHFGYLSCVVVRGKLLLRRMMEGKTLGWDDPLPTALHDM